MNNCSFFGEINLFKLKNKKINFLYLFCKTNGFLIFLGPFRILEYWEYCASRISRISRMCQSMAVYITQLTNVYPLGQLLLVSMVKLMEMHIISIIESIWVPLCTCDTSDRFTVTTLHRWISYKIYIQKQALPSNRFRLGWGCILI